MKRKCPNCGSIEESKFCTNCGQNLSGPDVPKICPVCGAVTTSKFCVQCGTKMDDEDAVVNKQNSAINKQDTNEHKKKQKEEEEKARIAKQKEEEEKARIAKQKEEEEKARIAKQKEEEEKARIAKQKEEEEKARIAKQKEEEEKARIAKQKEEEEKARIAKQKEEEEKARIAKQKEEEEKARVAKQLEEEKKRKEEIQNNIRKKKKYEEAISYMEYADKAKDKHVAADFYRKAEAIFDDVIGWEDAEEKSLLCARNAKMQELAIESEVIATKKETEKKEPILDKTENDIAIKEKDASTIKETTVSSVVKEKPATNKAKSKTALIAVLIGALVIGGVLFAVTQGRSAKPESNSETSSGETDNTGSSEASAGDLIAVDDGLKVDWDNGSVVLTHYQFEKTPDDGDVVNLYFDYEKTGGENNSFSGETEICVFQNGYQLDEKNTLTTKAEEDAYNELKAGAKINAAKGFRLNDASELTVVLTAYDKDYNPVSNRMTITIPENEAKNITGNKAYFEETGEKPIKDGISIKNEKGELKLTGYQWKTYEGDEMLIVYFDYTNLLDEEQSLSGSDFYVKIFQNGVEQESSGWSTSKPEEHYFSKVQNGKTMHCAYSYSVQDKSEIEVELTCYSDNGDITEEQVVSVN